MALCTDLEFEIMLKVTPENRKVLCTFSVAYVVIWIFTLNYFTATHKIKHHAFELRKQSLLIYRVNVYFQARGNIEIISTFCIK